MKVYTRDDTVHDTDYYLAKDARAVIVQIEREKHYAQDCLDAAKGEIDRLTGESGVLRGLLKDALSVLETITDERESDDWMLLMALKGKITAAITPQAETGGLL